MNEKPKPIPVRLSADTVQWLDRMAEKRGTNRSETIRWILGRVMKGTP